MMNPSGLVSNFATHTTHRAVIGMRRCAIEVNDFSLREFGIQPHDRAVVVITSIDDNKMMTHLKLVETSPEGLLLIRIVESDADGHHLNLISGNSLEYPTTSYLIRDVEIMGYVVYIDRQNKFGDWNQHYEWGCNDGNEFIRETSESIVGIAA